MIHRLRVQNFRSIIDVTVDFTPVTVLVGKSGTGKSNFVRSLRFLRDVLMARKGETASWNDTWGDIRPALISNAPTSFEVDFTIAGIEERFKYVLSLGTEGPQLNPLSERLDLGDRCLFEQGSGADVLPANTRIRKWIVAPELIHVPDPGAIALGRIPSISEIVIAFTALTSGIGCYLFSDTVLCGGKSDKSDPGLDDAATNYLDSLKEIVRNLQDLTLRKSMVGALQRVNPSVSSIELNDIQRPDHVIVGHRINGKTLALKLSQESDGFRRFYAHLLALYQRPPKQTLLFEHPEDGIHPGALSLLAEEFNAAPPSGRGQVIITTHSPRLLDHFNAEQIRVVQLDGLETRIGLLSIEQRDALYEGLLQSGELLTVDPARIRQEAPVS